MAEFHGRRVYGGERELRAGEQSEFMNLTQPQKKAVMVGAVGLGAVMLGQAWRRHRAYDFGSKSVIITGGSRGLGLVMARELADEGARLTLIARNEDELARAADDIRTRGRPPDPAALCPRAYRPR